MRVRIFVAGVGGQGSITATAIIGQAALASGIEACASEIHGMAQRGGVVESSVVLGDLRSPLVPDQGADVLLGMEPVEASRALRKCGPRTVVLVNTHPVIPFTVSLGREAYPDVGELLKELESRTRKVYPIDAVQLATQAGNVRAVGSVMLGALAGLGVLEIPSKAWLSTILSRVPAKATAANERAFQLGYEITSPSTDRPAYTPIPR